MVISWGDDIFVIDPQFVHGGVGFLIALKQEIGVPADNMKQFQIPVHLLHVSGFLYVFNRWGRRTESADLGEHVVVLKCYR